MTGETTRGSDKVFAGSIPKLYEAYLVPLVFEPYAVDIAHRLRSRPLRRVLEIAAGTGVVARALARELERDVAIVATDLNQPMIDQAAAIGTARPVEWRQADAQELPFDDASFDAVVCQFGYMFLPDKRKAFAQAHRVLRPGGALFFSVWDRIEENDFADAVTSALAVRYPKTPPRFLARTPHAYHARTAIEGDLRGGGFSAPARFVTVSARSRAQSPRDPAIGFCQATPLRSEIEALGASELELATDAAADAIARRFGRGPVEGKLQAHVVTVER
jgi:SAM-dependent methyltransferase